MQMPPLTQLFLFLQQEYSNNLDKSKGLFIFFSLFPLISTNMIDKNCYQVLIPMLIYLGLEEHLQFSRLVYINNLPVNLQKPVSFLFQISSYSKDLTFSTI